MPRQDHISVEIDATFGSAFQEESAVAALHKLMQAWAEFYHSKHSNTLIRFRVTNAELATTVGKKSAVSRTRAPFAAGWLVQ